MARGEADLLKQVLEKLMYLDPPIKKFPVTPEDPAMAVYFLDLKDVCKPVSYTHLTLPTNREV